MTSTIDEFLPTSTAQSRTIHGRSGRFDKMWGFQHRETFCQVSLNCPFPHALWMNYCSTESGGDDERMENEGDKGTSTAEVVEGLNRQGGV